MKRLVALLVLVGPIVLLGNGARAQGELPIDAAHCTASGIGISGQSFVKAKVPILIQARDANGNPLGTGGADFFVAVTRPDGRTHEVSVVDNLDGTYSAEYNVHKPGVYEVTITLGGINISQSPFSVPFPEP
jgi:hypothetical protein